MKFKYNWSSDYWKIWNISRGKGYIFPMALKTITSSYPQVRTTTCSINVLNACIRSPFQKTGFTKTENWVILRIWFITTMWYSHLSHIMQCLFSRPPGTNQLFLKCFCFNSRIQWHFLGGTKYIPCFRHCTVRESDYK